MYTEVSSNTLQLSPTLTTALMHACVVALHHPHPHPENSCCCTAACSEAEDLGEEGVAQVCLVEHQASKANHGNAAHSHLQLQAGQGRDMSGPWHTCREGCSKVRASAHIVVCMWACGNAAQERGRSRQPAGASDCATPQVRALVPPSRRRRTCAGQEFRGARRCRGACATPQPPRRRRGAGATQRARSPRG